jgi:hypothetical protein
MGILPPADGAPRCEGYRAAAFLEPAKEVGGDFYDFFTAPDGRQAVVIGDVSDKGVSAALFMSMAVTLVRYTVMEGLSCEEAMRRVNERLAANNPSCMFVTLFIGLFDPETGELEKRNRSPKKGTYYHAFKELYKIRPYLRDPNLRIKLILLEIEEYRLRDGWGRGGKRGSHRHDSVPTRILGETLLTQPMDYMQFIPYPLDEPFTSKELAKACGAGRQSFSTAALLLTELGVLKRVGKKGNAYLYRVSG